MAEVILSGVSKTFGATRAVKDLSLTIADGEFVVLLGPTGAGKTTTLRLIAGLEKPDGGAIRIGGRDVTAEPPAARDVTFVFQQYSLYPHLSVYDNLAFPLRSPARAMPEADIANVINDVADVLKIKDKLKNKATALSGGQMQRVAIGRALVRRPAVYLMDEPLSSLDAKLRSDLRLELKRIQADLGATILYVTHDQIEAMTLASRIGVIRDGELVQIGSPREIYENPADTYVAQRLGAPTINLLPVGLVAADRILSGTVTLGARTEHIEVTPGQSGPGTARVTRVEHLGDQSYLHVTIGNQTLVALVDPDTQLTHGDQVGLRLLTPLCFDASGTRIPETSP